MRQTAAGSSGTHSPPGHSNDPRKNQKEGCRRRTTDGNPSPFWQAAGPARASASSFREQHCHPFDIATTTSIRSIEQSKAHVFVRLLLKSRKTSEQTAADSQEIETTDLLFFLLLLLLLFCCSTSATTSTSTGSGNSTSSARRNLEKRQQSTPDQNPLTSIKRTEASFEEPSAISCNDAQRHTSQ